jgi:GT2 family glycosyltransferase
MGVVSEPGFMPPVFEGIRLASSDVVAFMDDDAEAEPGWTEGLLRHYADSSVGGVGGRYLNVQNDVPVPVPATDRVGYVTMLGRFIGNMTMTPTFREPRDVDFLIGGCMSYRREVARALEFDAGLNRDVAFGYEVDLGLQVRRAGWRLVFDPAVVVRHHSAPRADAGMRASSGAAVRAYSHNQLRVALRRLPWPQAAAAAGRALLLGERRAPGLAPLVLGPVARRLGFDLSVAREALAGRLEAIRSGRFRPAAAGRPATDR